MASGYVDFEFDLPGALLSNLVRVLDGLLPATLAPDFLACVPEAQGVYQLFLDARLTYIGKTDADAGLRSRLQRHYSKVQHRVSLDPSRISFKAIRIYVFTAVDLEAQLINHYGGYPAVPWNGSGFGSNDPGRERDTTTYRDNHFDAQFPIDIERQLILEAPRSATAASVLAALKDRLPYVFRFQNAGNRSRRPHVDLDQTIVIGNVAGPVTTRSLIRMVVAQLPPGWQATKLPSHVILYKEAPRPYPYGEVIAISPASTTPV